MAKQTRSPIPAGVALMLLLTLFTTGVLTQPQQAQTVLAAPLLTATLCPIPTTPSLIIDPPLSPTNAPTQTLYIRGWGWETVTASGPAGVFTGTNPAGTDPLSVTVWLKRGRNTFQLQVSGAPYIACDPPRPPVTLNAEVTIERTLICPLPPIAEFFVDPVITQTTGFTQMLGADTPGFGADIITATLRGISGTAQFIGRAGVDEKAGRWQIPIDLRRAGAKIGSTGLYTVEMQAHYPPFGDPECGIGDRVETKTTDRNGAPLAISLETGVCPAIAGVPPQVNPVISPWKGITQTLSGPRGAAIERIVVFNAGEAFTATLPTSATWRADVTLRAGRSNTLTVQSAISADTQCEVNAETNVDTDDNPLVIFQSLTRSVPLPIVTR